MIRFLCVNSYFLEKVEDEEVRPIIDMTLKASKENIVIARNIFEKEEFPIPLGFTEQDVNVKAQDFFLILSY